MVEYAALGLGILLVLSVGYSIRQRGRLEDLGRHVDRLSLGALEHRASRRRLEAQGEELLACHLENDELTQKLVEHALEIEDAIKTIENLSSEITIQQRVDAEEKKRVALLEKLVENLTQVRINGNGKADSARVVRKMVDAFDSDSLARFIQFNFRISGEEIYSVDDNLIERCMKLYMWAEDNRYMLGLMKALEQERPRVQWR